MTINGLSNYGGFQNYRVTDIPKVDIEDVKRKESSQATSESALESAASLNDNRDLSVETKAVETNATVDNRSRNVDLDNVSLTFNKGEDFSYLGSDFEIDNLDMQQAISDMSKDKILENYQFFVGTGNNLNDFSSEDGKVFVKF